MRTFFLFPLLVVPLLMACNAQVSEADFHEMLSGLYKETVPLAQTPEIGETIEKYVILDTREEEEYRVSHLPGALWVGYDNFQEEKLQAIPKNQPILVYCSVGYRSERIGEKLQEMGYQQVQNLYGGIFDWVHQGQTVVDSGEKPTTKVHTYNKKWSKWLFTGEKVY